MAIDQEKMRKDREAKTGGTVKLNEGDTVLYVHPPCRDDDTYPATAGLPYVEQSLHYLEGMIHLCLDPTKNPIVKHPFVLEFAKAHGFKPEWERGCPTCQKRIDGKMSASVAKKVELKPEFIFGVTPVKWRANPTAPYAMLGKKPGPFKANKTIWSSICDMMAEVGDITDPAGAVLVKINKVGQLLNTKYKIEPDLESSRKPLVLNKETARVISDSMRKGGDCDLFRFVAYNLKSYGEISAALNGVKVEDDSGDPAPEEH